MPVKNVPSAFRWWSLGGLGEVGMNCMVFDFGGTVVPVDAGIIFADTNNFGIEALYPDYSDLLVNHAPKHWIITHAHEDHIGAVAAMFEQAHKIGIEPPKIYAPPFAAAMLEYKLQEAKLFPHAFQYKDLIHVVEPGQSLEWPNLSVTLVPARHSTLESCSLAFQWAGPDGNLNVFHTADFKIDEHVYTDGVIKYDKEKVFGKNKVDILFVDSTNSERDGHSVAEYQVVPGLEKLINQAPGRVYVTLFASNVQRMAELMVLGTKAGREICLAGTSLLKAHEIALRLGLYEKYCVDISQVVFKDAAGISKLDPKKQLILSTGSQGEPRSVLRRIADGAHAEFYLGPDDTVIFSSKLIPGNEKRVLRMINGLLRTGARVHYGEKAKVEAGGPIHASGHARRAEIQKVIEIFEPDHVVPVHGELHQLMACAEIARSQLALRGVPLENVHSCEDGVQLQFERSLLSWVLTKREVLPPTDKYMRFDFFIGRGQDEFLRARKKMAKGGAVSVVLDSMGRVSTDMQGLFPETWLSEKDKGDLTRQIENWAFFVYKQAQKQGEFPVRDPLLLEELRLDLERHIRKWCGLRPLVFFHCIQL